MLMMLTGLGISYFLGAIPNAYIFAKALKGIDLRKHGSGNLGATNAFRVLGKGIGSTVLVLDILKGLVAVLLASMVFYSETRAVSRPLYLCLAAVTVVAGHNWTIFLGFKGGKGMATSLGVIIAFALLIPHFAKLALLVIALWIILFLSTGFVSLASVVCSVIIPFAGLFFALPKEIIFFLAVLGAFSLIRHKANIGRLLHKKEHRFNTRRLFKRSS